MLKFRSKLARTITAVTAVGTLAFGAVACEGENPVETDAGQNVEGEEEGVDVDVDGSGGTEGEGTTG